MALAVGGAVLLALVVVWWLWARRRGAAGREAAPASALESTAERLRRTLAATKARLIAPFEAALGRGSSGWDGLTEQLEEVLLAADVGVPGTRRLLDGMRTRSGGSTDGTALRGALRAEVMDVLASPPVPEPSQRPWVILVVGVNGVGKTTTIGKLAALHAARGRRVLLVAGDTFRAAAIDQLGIWAERTKSEVVRHTPGADPSAVVFDGMRAALARGVDIVLVDTAGRLHTRAPLMDELRKVRRVIEREIPGAPHETLLVVDATTGQNAVSQARSFTEAVAIDGLILTKLDGTARGGVVIALRHELNVPVRYVGVGEAVDDLRPFEASEFAGALFDAPPAS